MYIGQIEIPEGETIRSGQPRELTIDFISADTLGSELRPGRQWRLQEGATLVGMTTVISLEE